MFGLFEQSSKKKPAHGRDRRRMARIPEENATLVLDGVSYPLLDWSIEGFRARGQTGSYERGDEARARLIIVHRGEPIGFDTRARIVRVGENVDHIAGQFVSMSKAARKLIAKVYRERLALKQAELGITDENIDQMSIEIPE